MANNLNDTDPEIKPPTEEGPEVEDIPDWLKDLQGRSCETTNDDFTVFIKSDEEFPNFMSPRDAALIALSLFIDNQKLVVPEGLDPAILFAAFQQVFDIVLSSHVNIADLRGDTNKFYNAQADMLVKSEAVNNILESLNNTTADDLE